MLPRERRRAQPRATERVENERTIVFLQRRVDLRQRSEIDLLPRFAPLLLRLAPNAPRESRVRTALRTADLS